MKHVWILNHYALTPSSAGGTRHHDLAVSLRSHGWKAWIVASSVEHPIGRQRLLPGEQYRMEWHSDVPFLWVRSPSYKGNGLLRVANILAYSVRVLLPVSTHSLPRPDVIVGSTVHPFAALAGCILARRHAVPFVFEVRDLWPQTLIDFGRLRERGIAAWLLRRVERTLFRNASRIIVLLPYAADYIEATGISREKVVWIPNGVELSAYTPGRPARHREGEPFVLMYLGSHGEANGLKPILEAMRIVSQRLGAGAVKLRMIGNGPLKAELIAYARTLGLSDVSFEDAVPKNQVPAMAVQAHAFIVSIRKLERLYRFGISLNKLFDYLAAERPVIIASNAANNPVDDAGAGITVPPEDPESLAQAILALYSLPEEERQRMGKAGRKYVEANHCFNRLAERLAATLEDCCNDANTMKDSPAQELT